MSPSAKRAWIEIRYPYPLGNAAVSPSAKRAWIEILHPRDLEINFESPSAKRAWIEISCAPVRSAARAVALCEEGVDRNPSARW